MKALSQNDIQTAQSFLTQLVDVIQEDVSGSTTRRKYQVFVTGGIGPGVTSSLFQTVYDQDIAFPIKIFDDEREDRYLQAVCKTSLR